jgi:hypothetical protein
MVTVMVVMAAPTAVAVVAASMTNGSDSSN